MDDTMVEATPLIGISHKADVRSAAALMTARNISALGVYTVDGHDLLGIVTERNITRSVAGGMNPSSTPVEDIMSLTPAVAGPISHDEAVALMRSGHVRHLILREDGADKIISIRDLQEV
jgi:CBS domain-containing protein